MLRFIIALCALLLLNADSAHAQERALSLHDVYALARERNPASKAARAVAAAAAAREPSATIAPDPEIRFGAMNLSLPRLSSDMPSAMAPSIEAMQMVPFPGKLRLSGEIARDKTAMALSAADEVVWEVRTRAAMAFYEIYESDRKIKAMEETLDWLRQSEQVATTVYSVGRGSQSDVLRAAVEVARMRADIEQMRTMRIGAAARLNALLSRPQAHVPAVTLPPFPATVPDTADLTRWANETRPLLAGGRTAVEQAQTREQLARREIWPDLRIGVQYGQRSAGATTERMASAVLGITLPVFAGRRQLQLRREAESMTQAARAELADARAQVSARIIELTAQLARVRSLVTLYRSEVLPQAEANATSSLTSYRVGRVDFATLVDAQINFNQYRLELYDLLAEYGVLIAELEKTIGREIPVTDQMITEIA